MPPSTGAFLTSVRGDYVHATAGEVSFGNGRSLIGSQANLRFLAGDRIRAGADLATVSVRATMLAGTLVAGEELVGG